METDKAIVYLIDDDRSVRESIADLLASVGLGVRSFGSVQDFINADIVDAPGCIVLDVRMPGQSGMEFHQRMSEYDVRLPAILISGHGDIAMGVKAMKNGAIDFLAKPFRDQDLLDAVQEGIEKDRARRTAEAKHAVLRDRWATLTIGERDVMGLVVKGLLNKQIAGDLHISEITVKVRRGQLMRKMGAKSLADLIRCFNELNLNEPHLHPRPR